MGQRRALLAGIGVVALVLSLLQVPWASAPGVAASRDTAKAATVVYVALRAVNAALSVSQEIEVGASAVATASAQPLKVLEPVDDTIERIAGVVFIIAAASWVLSVAFQPVSAVGFAALGLGMIGMSVADRWPVLAGASKGIARLGFAFAVLLPLIYAGGILLGRVATDGIQAEASATLEGVAGEARKLIGREEAEAASTSDAEPGLLSGTFESMGQVREQVTRFSNAADYYWSNADVVLESAFILIAVFVLRIVVLPAVLLLLVWRLLGRLA